jgi:fructose-1,6-bisphosphatase II
MHHEWPPIERNIAMELVRVTEAAALAAARFLGRGNKNLVDEAAVSAMRYVLGYIQMDGTFIIGEGEKEEAPMLNIGEHIGDGSSLKVDLQWFPSTLEGCGQRATGSNFKRSPFRQRYHSLPASICLHE